MHGSDENQDSILDTPETHIPSTQNPILLNLMKLMVSMPLEMIMMKGYGRTSMLTRLKNNVFYCLLFQDVYV